MALSNRDRMQKMFEILSDALDRFLTEAVAGNPFGLTWPEVVSAVDEQKGGRATPVDPKDVQVQLRFITEGPTRFVDHGWRPVRDLIGHSGENYASELRNARNEWAHMKAFTDDDAYRNLDTGTRLLRLVNAPDAAEKVDQLRVQLRRVTAEKSDRKTLSMASTGPGSSGLKPWREVLQPHEDVASGNFQAAQFAADLHKVAISQDGTGVEYSDPVEFFRRTYLTEGLRDLITRTLRRLGGDQNASPVINLQTNFGGGKTHSMLALWHLAAGRPLGDFPQDAQELFQQAGYDELPGHGVRRVALVGTHVAPSGTTKPDGTHVNTMWGELAWQLGGRDAYDLVADSDRHGTAPGQALHELLQLYTPAVILIDEWVAYARQLYGKDESAGGSFDTQFTFAQALTEAAKSTPGIMLAISIPASHSGDSGEPVAGSAEEVGGTNGIEALRRLQNVVRRVADQWRPASHNEAYHIVRQRLFVEPNPDAHASIRATARAFVDYYRSHPGDFPRETRDAGYEERIRQTYPIHPELFDRLYQDWSSLERFQRTRGVLRLMNTVIHALWVGQDAGPMIMPGSIPLAVSEVNSELTQYLQDSWKAVIDADVDGPESEPARLDQEKPLFGARAIATRLARTVFFGAAPTIGAAHKGLETQRVFLGTAIPGDVPGNFHSALASIADRTTYFYSAGGKHWYDLQANITRSAKDQAARLHPEEVWAEITRRLQAQAGIRGPFTAMHVCPESSGDVPDLDEARLVLLPPSQTHKNRELDSPGLVWAAEVLERRGTAHRSFRNMLVFLAPDRDRMAELDAAVRDFLGWSHVLDNATDLDLTASQHKQATARRDKANETVDSRMPGTYQWALVPVEEPGEKIQLQVRKVDGSAPLAERVGKRLGNDGRLATSMAARLVRMHLDNTPALWQRGWISVGELWDAFAKYAYLPRLRDSSVLRAAVLDQPMLWTNDGFALAEGYDGSRLLGLSLPEDPDFVRFNVTDQVLVVQSELALAQREQEKPLPDSGPVDDAEDQDGARPGPAPAPSEPAGPNRFYGSVRLASDHYAKDFARVQEHVLAHLAATPGAQLRISLDIEATVDGEFSDEKIRTVSENAGTLKFDNNGFERD